MLYCILLKNDSLSRILRFPGYFETPLFRTFFHIPWDFKIAGFDCTYHVFPSLSLFPKALYDPSERLYVNSLWYPNTNN